MVETQVTLSSMSAAESLKASVEQLRSTVDTQQEIINAEKAKGRKADRAKLQTARQALEQVLPSAAHAFNEYSRLRRRAASEAPVQDVLNGIAANFTDQGHLEDRAQDLLNEIDDIEAAIPSIDSPTQVAQLVESISQKEEPTEAELLAIYLFEQMQVLRGQVADLTAARGAAGTVPGTTVVSPIPEGAVVEPGVTAVDTVSEDVIDKMIRKGQEWYARLRNKTPNTAKLEKKELESATRVMKNSIGKEFSAILGILETPTTIPEGTVARKVREAQLFPFLAVLEVNGVIVLTDEAKQKVDQEYQDDGVALARKLGEVDKKTNAPAIQSLLLWARRNIHRLQALPEVVGAAPVAATPDEPEATVNPAVAPETTLPAAPVSTSAEAQLLQPAPAASGEPVTPPRPDAVARPVEPEKDRTLSKKLKDLFAEVRQQIPVTVDNDTKVNKITVKPASRSRILGLGYQRFTEVLSGKAAAFDPKNSENVQALTMLLVAAEVPDFYDSLQPKPVDRNKIIALVDKIAAL